MTTPPATPCRARRVLPFVATLAAAAAASSAAYSQVIVSQNFDSYVGTAASVPAGFTVSGSQSGGYAGVFTDGLSGYSTTNGLYAGTSVSTPGNDAFVARVPVSNNLILSFTATNTTGFAATGLTITFNEVQFQDAVATPNNLALFSDDGAGSAIGGNTTAGFDQANLSGNDSVNELSAGGTGTVYTTPLTANETVTYNAPVAAGASVEFEFAWAPGGGGNRPIFGVDNLVVAANESVPEPSSMALAALSGIGMLGFFRRRRSSATV